MEINCFNDLQSYVKLKSKERKFDSETLKDKGISYFEEIGESQAKVAKLIKKLTNLKTKNQSKINEIHEKLSDEFSDVIFLICDTANLLNIDLDKAFKKKEKENDSKIWT
jgi:NTP pyrophosphatase (non-canonical NTP hydrolase)